MEEWKQRTELLLNKEAMLKLKNATVLVVGLGGVGGMAAEMICRTGVGRMTIADGDTVSETNINRQIVALNSTVGKLKTDVLAERLKDINPALDLSVVSYWLDEENIVKILDEGKYDFVIDAIDTIVPKVFLIKTCVEKGINVISSMGSGAKMDFNRVRIADISETNYCALARVVRKRLTKLGIHKGVPVVFTDEIAKKESVVITDEKYKKSYTGTVSYMPALFGLNMTAYVIQRLIDA